MKRPFEELKNPKLKDKTPKWWRAYNDLKHDFYSEIEEGTLENALLSLGALFILNCKIPLYFKLEENINYLVTNEIITSPNFIHADHLLNYMKKDPKLEEYSLLAQTDLIKYWLSYNKSTIGYTVVERLHATDRMIIPVGKDMFD